MSKEEREYMAISISMKGKYSEEFCLNLSDSDLEELYKKCVEGETK